MKLNDTYTVDSTMSTLTENKQPSEFHINTNYNLNRTRGVYRREAAGGHCVDRRLSLQLAALVTPRNKTNNELQTPTNVGSFHTSGKNCTLQTFSRIFKSSGTWCHTDRCGYRHFEKYSCLHPLQLLRNVWLHSRRFKHSPTSLYESQIVILHKVHDVNPHNCQLSEPAYLPTYSV